MQNILSFAPGSQTAETCELALACEETHTHTGIYTHTEHIDIAHRHTQSNSQHFLGEKIN